ncbi:tRNA-dihydrouridine synthase 1 [[Emmonsia] crescens]|uniref:tRNA-dihydrouridine(16/17) synthase [NAD(P)(+)] n=1 Tax=[Emmonsia] crescens TaxID=73230 RepID=A0A2B7ZE13_9EURO|nr:tRNA-dihydrouridine synthase 1 [Emmonsia crescens]
MAAPLQPKKKLFGREFYKSLGSPKMILAPMVDRSEFAWRMLTRSFMDPDSPNPLLAYSPMFHSRLFKESPNYRLQHFEATRPKPKSTATATATLDDEQSPYLDGNPSLDRPLIVQFCANDPDDLLQAARTVEPFCDAIDLNLGCPQGIARKGHYGAFLQEHPDLIYKLINTLHTQLSIPVTAKFRIQETKEKTLEYARLILSAGASIISVHGRRREQKGHNTGLADWSYIRYLRDNLPADTVIFANGNILNHADIERCLEATGADGVMSAEGNLCDPTIFRTPPSVGGGGETGSDGAEYWMGRNGKGGYRADFVLRRYMDIIYKYVLEVPPPERKPLFVSLDSTTTTADNNNNNNKSISDPTTIAPAAEEVSNENGADCETEPPKKKRKRTKEDAKPTSPNLVTIQGHLFQLLRPLISKHTHIRDALSKCRAGRMSEIENIVSLVEGAVKSGIQEYEAFPERFEEEEEEEEEEAKSEKERFGSSKATVAQYKRPWWVCQPYVRPLPEEALQIGALQPKKRDILVNVNKSGAGKIEAGGGGRGEREEEGGLASSTPDEALSGSDKENSTLVPPTDKLVSG